MGTWIVFVVGVIGVCSPGVEGVCFSGCPFMYNTTETV